jgi:hypothetical protein
MENPSSAQPPQPLNLIIQIQLPVSDLTSGSETYLQIKSFTAGFSSKMTISAHFIKMLEPCCKKGIA